MDIIEFLQMGGYAFYVWWSYSLTLLVLFLNYLLPVKREQRLLRKLAKRTPGAGG